MKTVMVDAGAARLSWAQVVVGVGGVFYILTGLVMLFAPGWFFENIGNFPPFNRHYVGDLGAFILPLGAGLLWAARRPAAHRLTVGIAAAASLLHALNHAYDDWAAGSPPGHWLGETIPLLAFAVLMIAAYRSLAR